MLPLHIVDRLSEIEALHSFDGRIGSLLEIFVNLRELTEEAFGCCVTTEYMLFVLEITVYLVCLDKVLTERVSHDCHSFRLFEEYLRIEA